MMQLVSAALLAVDVARGMEEHDPPSSRVRVYPQRRLLSHSAAGEERHGRLPEKRRHLRLELLTAPPSPYRSGTMSLGSSARRSVGRRIPCQDRKRVHEPRRTSSSTTSGSGIGGFLHDTLRTGKQGSIDATDGGTDRVAWRSIQHPGAPLRVGSLPSRPCVRILVPPDPRPNAVSRHPCESGRCAHHVEIYATRDSVHPSVAMQLPDDPSVEIRSKEKPVTPKGTIKLVANGGQALEVISHVQDELPSPGLFHQSDEVDELFGDLRRTGSGPAIAGQLEIDSRPGGPTVISAVLPAWTPASG